MFLYKLYRRHLPLRLSLRVDDRLASLSFLSLDLLVSIFPCENVRATQRAPAVPQPSWLTPWGRPSGLAPAVGLPFYTRRAQRRFSGWRRVVRF